MFLFTEFECPTITDKKCKAFWKKLLQYPGHNLKKGLKCIGYNENITGMQALKNDSELQRIDLDVIEANIIQINEEKQYGIWEFKSKVIWYDLRLQWPQECQSNNSKTNLNIIRSDILRHLWNPVSVFQEIANNGKPVFENTMAIGEVKLT